MQRIALKCGRFYRTIPRSVNSSVNNYNKSVPILQYSSTTPSIGSKTLSNNRDDKVIERSILRRNVMQSTESKDCTQIECIKFFADENILQIQFIDGQTLNFNTFWLRDSCLCPKCVHPLSKTKLFDCADISTDLFVDRVDCFHHIIEVQWRSSSSDAKEEHISQYSISWLRLFGDIFDANPKTAMNSNSVNKAPNDGLYDSREPKPQTILWDSNQMNKQKMSLNYNHFMNSNESLQKYLKTFCQFGVAFLEDVPKENNRVLSVAQRMSYEKTSTYGTSFDAIFKPHSNGQIPHMETVPQSHSDFPYRERSPAVQLIHCIEKTSIASTLVDGFKCAETLRQRNPDHFQCLTEYPVIFSFCDNEKGVWFRQKRPIIELNSDQTIKQIHYNHQSMRPPLLPSHQTERFYESYRKLTKLIRDDRHVYRYSLRPGDLVMFDNRRILQAREESDHLTQLRHLEVCYVDSDQVIAFYEKLTA